MFVKKTNYERINTERIIVVEHEANEVGPGHILIQYFKEQKIDNLVYIGHPNLYIKSGFQKSSRMVHYKRSGFILNRSGRYWKLPEWGLYIKDIIYTLYWVINLKGKYDVFIGLGNINALCGILLKKIGKVKTVVYYVIDYIPNRFENKLLNAIYIIVERYAALWSDNTWNLSSRMIVARNKRWNMEFSNQYVVPHGLYFDVKKIYPYSRIHKHELIYLGNLNREQGIDLVIESIKELKKDIPDISFVIVGSGNYEKELKHLSVLNHLEKNVVFLGNIKDSYQMEKRIGQAALAVAMYNPDHKFSMYSDPGKIKHYLSVGLPIVMTGLPQIAEKIHHTCGEVIPYNSKYFIQVVRNILMNEQILKKYKLNAFQLAKQYDWNKIIDEALLHLSVNMKTKR